MPDRNASPTEIATYAYFGGIRGKRSIATMVAISLAESGGNITATHTNSNGSTDYGLWQINSIHSNLLSSHDWKNPVDNAKMAKSILDSQGITAWTTYNSGAYKRYMKDGMTAASRFMVKMDELPDNGNLESLRDLLVGGGQLGWNAITGNPVGETVNDAVEDTVDKIPGVAEAKTIASGVSWITDTSNWRRLGLIVFGAILVLMGLISFVLGETSVGDVINPVKKIKALSEVIQ